MNDYCIVVCYGKYGLRKEIFRGSLKECREKREKHCEKIAYVYDAKEKTITAVADDPNGDWTIKIGVTCYDVKIKKVKDDNSIYNTWDVESEDDFEEKLFGHRPWKEIIEAIKE